MNKPEHGLKGVPKTPQHRANLSKSHMGIQTWLGRNHTEESKSKISESRLLALHSGDRFGKLVIESFSRVEDHEGGIWNVVCDCGKRFEVPAGQISKGRTKSCGCLRKEANRKRILSPEESTFRTEFIGYQRTAKLRYLSWELNEESFRTLILGDCFYCGVHPNRSTQDRFGNVVLYNGVDRLDSSQGYISSNVVSCCKICNYMKRSLSVSEFLTHVKSICDRSLHGQAS